MVNVLKQGATKKNIQLLLRRILQTKELKGIDAYKYCGAIRLKADALSVQKKMRDEWK